MTMTRSQLIAVRIVALAAVVVSLHLATTPLKYPVIEDINDKVQHLLAFFALALLADFSLPASEFGTAKALSVLGYGLLIEIIQYFLPYRSSSLLDLGADGIGILAYWLSLPALRHVPVLRRRWRGAD